MELGFPTWHGLLTKSKNFHWQRDWLQIRSSQHVLPVFLFLSLTKQTATWWPLIIEVLIHHCDVLLRWLTWLWKNCRLMVAPVVVVVLVPRVVQVGHRRRQGVERGTGRCGFGRYPEVRGKAWRKSGLVGDSGWGLEVGPKIWNNCDNGQAAASSMSHTGL